VALAWAAPEAQAQTWMVSTSPLAELSISSTATKFKPATATFSVRNEKTGKIYTLVKTVEEPQLTVLFPTESGPIEYFKTAANESAKTTPGRYVWECTIDGVRVGGGYFAFEEVGNDVAVRDLR